MEAILYKDNLNRAYKRVKANKGAAGIDGITIEKALLYPKEQGQEFVKRGVPWIRYANDIVLLAKSKRASERLLESSTKSYFCNKYAFSKFVFFIINGQSEKNGKKDEKGCGMMGGRYNFRRNH